MKTRCRLLSFHVTKAEFEASRKHPKALVASAINHTRKIICACVSACAYDRTRYMTRHDESTLTFRPWPDDSFFPIHLISKLSVVQHVAKRLDFYSTFLSTFNYSCFSNVYQPKIFTIKNICPPNETLLRMLSLDFLDKVAKRVDFHPTTILSLDFFDKE